MQNENTRPLSCEKCEQLDKLQQYQCNTAAVFQYICNSLNINLFLC